MMNHWSADHCLEALHRLAWRRYSRLFLFLVPAFFFISGVSLAAETKTSQPAGLMKTFKQKAAVKKTNEKTVEKTVTGTVMFVRKDRMAVEFAQNEETGGEDLLLKLDKKVKVKHIKDLLKIKTGDQVRVKYTETYLEPKKKGDAPTVLSRVGTEVVFVKNAPPLPKPSDMEVFSV